MQARPQAQVRLIHVMLAATKISKISNSGTKISNAGPKISNSQARAQGAQGRFFGSGTWGGTRDTTCPQNATASTTSSTASRTTTCSTISRDAPASRPAPPISAAARRSYTCVPTSDTHSDHTGASEGGGGVSRSGGGAGGAGVGGGAGGAGGGGAGLGAGGGEDAMRDRKRAQTAEEIAALLRCQCLHFCTSAASKLSTSRTSAGTRSSSGVSICTFVPVKQVSICMFLLGKQGI
jgi:hypothetical protein